MPAETTDSYYHLPYTAKEPSNQMTLNQILELGDDCNLFPETIKTCEASTSDLVAGRGQSCSSGSRGGNNGATSTFKDPSFCSPFSSSSLEPYSLSALPSGPSLEPPMAVSYSRPLLPLAPLSSPMAGLANLWKMLNNGSYPSNLNRNVNNNGYAMSPTPSEEATKLSQISSSIPTPIALEGDSLMTFPTIDYSTSHDLESTACSFLDPIGSNMGMLFPGSLQGMPIPGDARELLVPMPELADHETDVGGLGIFASRQVDHSPPDMQKVFDDCQNLIGVSESPTWLPSHMATLSESSSKIGRISVEERKEKIDRYVKKRSERNFSKKIKYACRKTLADSRPRVRGRFAKNDDDGEAEAARPIPINHHNHEEGEEEDDMMIKDEDLLNSSTIFSHLSSFRCNFTLESLI